MTMQHDLPPSPLPSPFQGEGVVASTLSPEGRGQGEGRWQPYPAYKDSEVAWLRNLPDEWKVMPLKYACKASAIYGANISAESYTSDGTRFIRTSDIDDTGNLLHSDAVYLDPEIIDSDYLLQDGDILLSRSGTIGRSFIYRQVAHGNCAYAGYLVRFITNQLLDPDYFFYFTKTTNFSEWLSITVISNTIGNVNGQKYANMPLPVPRYDEQRAIASFLDRETAKIDALIAKKQRLIELLKEKRTALISQAVTRGLDPDVPLKESGNEWIDQIPIGWTGTSLKRWVETKITDGPHETPDFINDGVPFVSAEAVQGGTINFNSKRGYISYDQHQRYAKKLLPKRDDVFLVKSGATTGKLAKVEADIEFNVWSPLTLIRADKNKVDPDFVFHALQSDYIQKQIQQTWSAGTQPNISMGDIERLYLVAPDIHTQKILVRYIQQELGAIDALILKVQEAVEILQEYRTALISAAVTGKIDVRQPSPLPSPFQGEGVVASTLSLSGRGSRRQDPLPGGERAG